MMNISDAAYEDLYRTAMNGIGCKVALQSIRKVIRDNTLSEEEKLGRIRTVIHSFEKDIDYKEGE